MTELRSGENRPWPDPRATVYVAGSQVRALLLGADGRALGPTPWVAADAPTGRGVEHVPGSVQGVTALLADVEAAVERVVVVASGWAAAPTAQVLTSDGAVALTVTPVALTDEQALVMVEVYRRQGAWKVRALAQGYAGGLTALAAAYGAPDPVGSAPPPAPAAPPPPPPPPAHSSPRPASGQSPSPPGPAVDPVRQVAMILDDASRTTASYESSVAFADRRHEQDLEHLVGDPSLRIGPAADAARAQAQQRRDELVGEARRRYDADLAQLAAEVDGLAQVLAPSLAPWGAPGWQGRHRPAASEAAWAFRLGEIAPEAAPHFRLPMVRGLPLHPPLWIETDDGDGGGGGDVVAARMMAALATRLMLALPRAPRLGVVDVGDRAMLGHLPTSGPPATDPLAAAQVLREHVEHLRMISMARSSGSLDDLPPQHRPGRVLLLPDFPGALDDSSVDAVHQLVTHGAECGVSVVLSGRRTETLGIPVLDLVRERCLRIPTAPGGDLVDAYGGVAWVFHPDLGPDDPFLAQRVQDVVAQRVAERDAP